MTLKTIAEWTPQRGVSYPVFALADGAKMASRMPCSNFLSAGTMVAIHSTLKEDLYVVYAGQSPDTQLPVIHAYLNPLVKCIWFGGVIVLMGTIVALLPNTRAVLVLSTVDQPARAATLVEGMTPSPALREGHD